MKTTNTEPKPGPRFADMDRLFRALQRLNLGPVRMELAGIIYFGDGEWVSSIGRSWRVNSDARKLMIETAYKLEVA